MNRGIAAAIAIEGSQTKLAEVLGYTQTTISRYLYCALNVPIRVALELERRYGIDRAKVRADLRKAT